MGGLDGFYACRHGACLTEPLVGRRHAVRVWSGRGTYRHARNEGSLRLDVARFGRGTDPIVRVSGAGDGSQAARPVDRVFARAPAVPAGRARPAADRTAGFAHRRLHPRERDLCRPLLVRRQGGGVRRPLAVRGQGAVRGLVGGAARVQLAAPSARRRLRHHPRQCARAGRRMDFAAGLRRCRRQAAGGHRAPDHLLDQPGAAGARRFRRPVLPALPAQPDAPGPAAAAHRGRRARRRAAAAVDDRADVRVAVHGQPGAPHQGRRQAPERRARTADPARRRAHQPQSRRADRAPGRSAAAAARCSPPATCRRRRR